MSDYQSITLLGKSKTELINELREIELFYKGFSNCVKVKINDSIPYKLDTLENIKYAVENNLIEYVLESFIFKGKILKTGGNDDLHLVDDPDFLDSYEKKKKVRNKMTHLIPKKKKRK